jgi:hypothetical protein
MGISYRYQTKVVARGAVHIVITIKDLEIAIGSSSASLSKQVS